MKLTKNFILEMIRDTLSEDVAGEPIYSMGAEAETEMPSSEEIKQQSMDAMGKMVAVLDGVFDQLQEVGEMIRGLRPELNGDVAEAITVIDDLMTKLNDAAREVESGETD